MLETIHAASPIPRAIGSSRPTGLKNIPYGITGFLVIWSLFPSNTLDPNTPTESQEMEQALPFTRSKHTSLFPSCTISQTALINSESMISLKAFTRIKHAFHRTDVAHCAFTWHSLTTRTAQRERRATAERQLSRSDCFDLDTEICSSKTLC